MAAGIRRRLGGTGATGGVLAVVGVALVVGLVTPLDLFTSGVLAVATVGVAALVLFPGARSALVRRTGVGLGAWAAAGLLFAGGVALTYALGSPQPFCERPYPSHRGCLTGYGLGAALFLAGAAAGAVALGHAGRYRDLSGTPVVGAGTADPGRRTVVGRVQPAGETRRAPSGAEAVWYRYEVLADDPEGGERTVAAGTEFAQFYVEDGSGRLLVVPREVDGYLATAHARTATTTVAAGDPLPVDADVAVDRPRRVREWRIDPDDVVTASGTVTEVSRAEYPAGTALGVAGEVLLATGARDELVGSTRGRVLVGAALAVLVGGAGYAAMLLAL